jgi:hypothetical protein
MILVINVVAIAVTSATAAENSQLTQVGAVSNAEETGLAGKVYFIKPDSWEGTTIYCHIFEADGSMLNFFSWQTKNEQCTEVSGNKYEYDLNNLSKSTIIIGGIQFGRDYSIMFSDNDNNEGCPIAFNTSVIGDTYRITDTDAPTYENSVDSTKRQWTAGWTVNAKKYGLSLMITSVGTIQGEFVAVGDSIEKIISRWDTEYQMYPNDTSYSSQSIARTHKERLAEIKAELLKNAKEGKYYFIGGGTYVDPTEVTLKSYSATVYRTGTTTIKATVKNSKGTTTYTTGNKNVATVNSKGVVTAKSAGTTKIKVANNQVFKIFTVTVKNPTLNVKSKQLKPNKTFTLKITGKIGKATFTSGNSKIAKVNSSGKVIAKKKGNTTILVKTNGITLKCKVKVK